MNKTFSMSVKSDEKRRVIDCPVCGSSSFSHHWSCQEFSYVHCNDCSLVYQNPQPLFESLDERYDEEYFHYERKNDEIFYQLMILGLRDANFSDKPPEGINAPRFLDIGCATGLLVKHMDDKGWNSCGVEICAPAATWGREKRGISIFTGTLEQASFESESFDVIHCSHLIEHLNDPHLFLEQVFTLLKSGGTFLCTTPNVDGFQAKLFRSDWRSAIADHTFLFSKKTLKKLFVSRGFFVEKIATWGGIGGGYAPVPIKSIVDHLAKRWNFGDVMILRARKK